MLKKIFNFKKLDIYKLILLALILFLCKSTNFFNNFHNIVSKNHNFRLQNSYGFCHNTGTGYVIYLKEKFNIEKPPVIRNFNKAPPQYWVFNTINYKIRDENKLIILNKDYKFKVDLSKYKIIDNYKGRCFFLEKI